jgi:membrane associated rhomboid family serine protease
MLGPYPDALSECGGKNAPMIVEDGQWWRLFTPIMLHAGIIHLAGNIAVQLEMGIFFEKEWGSIRWLIIYLGSGFGSSILSVIFMPQAVSVGSSKAVMGLFGAKLAELILRAFERKVTAQQRVAHEVRCE